MGQAALRHDVEADEAPAGRVVQLKSASPVSRPDASAAPLKSELPGLLNIISRSSGLLATQKDRADTMEKRALAAEEQLKAANRKLADVEIKLKAALEDLKAERARATDVQKRSGDVVEKTRSMLSDASERLRLAETRAERAESSFTTIRTALEQQLADFVK